jgi:pyruvate formate lyase activating enzyme
MKIAGFTKNSFVDYPGRISSVVFFAGCNYDCFFCHNRSIIGADAAAIEEDPVWEFLSRRRGLLDAVVLTGGEPTLQAGLQEFLARVKRLGYLCKLDTNGSRP